MRESANEDLLREVDAGSAGGGVWLNPCSLFLGAKDFRGSAFAVPELEDYAATELAAWAAASTERSKAREEVAVSKSLGGPAAAPAHGAAGEAAAAKRETG